MTDRAWGERSFDFGAWSVQPALGVLRAHDDGHEVRIEPKQMELLLLFAGSGGGVLSKDQIIGAVWQGRAIGDDTLAAAVSRLRAALGADRDRRYIETVPKRGYRLVLPSGAIDAAAPEQASSSGSEANRLVAQGRALLASGAPTALPQARLYFETAISSNPRSAEAQAGLAESLFAQHMAGQAPAAALLPAARAAAHAAIGLDPTSAAGWSALGYAHLVVDRDFAKADGALMRAIALAPGAAGPRRTRAFALVAASRFVEAERAAREALALAPLSLATRASLLQVLLTARRYRPAVTEARAMIDLSAQSPEAWYSLGWAHVLAGAPSEGVDALLQGLALWGVDAAHRALLQAAYAERGLVGLCAAGADLFDTQQVLFTPRPTDIAMLRAMAGQVDQAFAALDRAAERADPYLLLLNDLPWFDGLNNDPRWRPLVERFRLKH